jgi:hypothetical protein
MKLMSQIRSSVCLTPTVWPAKTWLRLIFWRLKQMRPHVVIVTALSWKG